MRTVEPTLSRQTRSRRGTAPLCLFSLALLALGLQALPAAPVDLAAAAQGASLSGPRNSSGCSSPAAAAIDGQVDDYDTRRGYMWADLDVPLLIRLAAPATLTTVEVLLLDVDARTYGYVIETSLDGEHWDLAADRATAADRGWQMHRFAPRQAERLRLRVTRTSLPTHTYHVVEVAAYDLPEAVTTTPLRQAWENARARAKAAAAGPDLLGVPEAQALLNDAELLREVRALRQGAVILRDLDHDGDPDAMLYRDGTAIVVALDDDDDMRWTDKVPDGRDDCLAVDTDGDGTLDRVVDYADEDHNGVPDHMVQTYATGSPWGRQALVLVVDLDQRGPKRLWSLTPSYGYDQARCQWSCDFGGDGFFVMFARPPGAPEWTGSWENPFCFYDPDGDGLAEETVRISGNGRTLRSARYGINADNDVTAGQDYDYDVSITTLGQVEPDAAEFTRGELRQGRRTGEFLRWERVREVVRAQPWSRSLLIWDENDRNVEPGDSHERWEGIINSAYRGFPQEGGPSCGLLNKRYELDADYSGKMQLYLWPADRRLHLFGAEQGTFSADADGDGTADVVIEYRDRDGDGFFDRREISTRNPARTRLAASAPAPTETLVFSFAAIGPFWPALLADTLAAQRELLDRLDAVDRAGGDRRAAARPAPSIEAQRFAADAEIELRFARLLAPGQESAGLDPATRGRLQQAQELTDLGRLREAASVLRGQAPLAVAATAAARPLPAAAAQLGDKITAGWESELIAYRAYWGKIDVFGKTDGQLRLADFNRPETDYHKDLGWGMDILNNGLTSGLGGLNLWPGGTRLQAQWTRADDPAVPLRYRVVAPGPAAAAVEMAAAGWETPYGKVDLTYRFGIMPGQRHTLARLALRLPGPGEVEFGPGLTTFPQAQMRSSPEGGYVWVWGDQGIGAGAVGLALVFDPALCRRIEPVGGEVLVHLAAAGPAVATDFLLSAAWAKEGTFTSAEAWQRYVEALAASRPPRDALGDQQVVPGARAQR